MEAFYSASLNTRQQSVTKEAYQLWIGENPGKRTNVDYSKLANVRKKSRETKGYRKKKLKSRKS